MLTRYGLPLVAIVAVGFAVIQMTKAQTPQPVSAPPVEPAKSPYANQLAGSGLVEPESENIAVGSQLPGVVERVLVTVGDTVRTGDPLFRLDPRQSNAELVTRQATLAAAQAQLDKLEAGARPEEIPAAEAKVAESVAMVREQAALFDRYKSLSATNAVGQDEMIRRDVGLEAAKAQLARVRADLALLKSGAWSYDRAIAAAGVRQAEAQVAATRTDLDRLTVRAPRGRATATKSAGEREFRVLQVNVRPGEFVASTAGVPLIVLGHVGHLHARVDIDENDIARFRPGLKGVAKPRGAPGTEYKLSFVRVEPYVIPKKSLTGGNTERVDTRVLQVVYAIEPGGPPLYVGQQLDVFLDAGE